MSDKLKELLIPYQIPFKKVRFGRKGDGGYIVFNYELDKLDGVYSYGISDDISFDLDLIKYTKANVYMFDHTIHSLPVNNPQFILTKEPGNIDNLKRHLHTFTPNTNKLILKMDIEAHEWDIFNIIDEETICKFQQLIIEFHNLEFLQNNVFNYVDITYDKMINTFKNINKYFYLGHIHGNNCGGMKDIPNTVECTYIRKDLLLPKVETDSFPVTNLDYPNNPTIPDYHLKWWIK